MLGAYAAFRAGDPDKLARHAAALQGHPLEPWADYWRLRLRIEDAKAADVQPFLTRHAGTYLADLLRSDWLRELGRRGDWQGFERELGPLAQEDLELRCYGWSARLARGDGEAAVEARAAWLEPRELPDGCVPLTEKLLKSGAIDQARIWQRVRLLLEVGQVSAARRAIGYLPVKEQPDERLLTQAAVAPQKLLAQPPRNLERRATREVLLFAVTRLARSDARAAAAVLEGALGERLSAGERGYLWVRIATQGAMEHMPEALEWYARAGDAPLADEHLAWKARAALRAGEWSTLRAAIDPMSILARQDPAWTYWYGRALAAQGDAGGRARLLPAHCRATLLLQRARHRGAGRRRQASRGRSTCPPRTRSTRRAATPSSRARWSCSASACDRRRPGSGCSPCAAWKTASCSPPPSSRAAPGCTTAPSAPPAAPSSCTTTACAISRRSARCSPLMPAPTTWRKPGCSAWCARRAASSWTRARVRVPPGLMQLLPHTARWVAQKIGYRGYSAKRVADVDTNITLGTRYLKFVLDGTGHRWSPRRRTTRGRTARAAGLRRARWKPRCSSRPSPTARRAST